MLCLRAAGRRYLTNRVENKVSRIIVSDYNKRLLASLAFSRLVLLGSVMFYALCIGVGHEFYLSREQLFWGFNSPHYNVFSIVVAIIFVVLPSCVLPLSVSRPSTVFLYSLVFFVYIPSVVIAMLNYEDSLSRYFWVFLSFCIGIVFCSVVVRMFGADIEGGKGPSATLILLNIFGAFVCFFFLFDAYKDILSFSGLNDIYAQRERGAATSLFIGYCQVYLAYVFGPLLFVYGLVYKRIIVLVFASFCFVLVFMITAERTIILLPFALFAICFVFKRRGFVNSNISYLFLLSGVVILVISASYQTSNFISQLGVYFFTRVIAIPGLFVSQYYDLFSTQGYTHWSHVSLIGRLAEVPPAYINDDKWPALGKILAERVLGIESQSNANFVATDGVAAWGGVGVLVIMLVYSGWLLVLDWAARGWNKLFVFPLIFPMAFVSTNGSLFTMIASFGGFFWMASFFLDKYKFRTKLKEHCNV